MRLDHLWLDADGVTANVVDPLAIIHGVEHRYPNWPHTYDLSVALRKSQDDIWSHPSVRGSEFWATLPKHDWADDLVRVCLELFPDRVSFLSQCVRDPWCAAGKVRWFQEHYPGVPYLVGTEKVLVARPGFVLVDDYQKNIREWNKRGGTGVLFPAPWNELRGHPDPVGLVERQLRERIREGEEIHGQ